jgi:hypothetical protein
MFDLRIEDDGIVRWYKTDDYNSAVVLFDVLCRKFGHVQLHNGSLLISEYQSNWAREYEEDAEYSFYYDVEARQP